uniref:TACO1/YebC-like N-terminal domain-containing protein n=1 Tax=Timema shepardi TaxID=629360 RepID=A0A7R9G504_TIMSH|nr:unnamed protein product [Timema shepardi]
MLEGNGTNPDFNVQLSQALEQAKKNSMPRATVENAINQAKTSKLQSKQSFLELRGPAGSIFIVSILSDNTPRVKNDLHSIVRKSNMPIDEALGRLQNGYLKLMVIGPYKVRAVLNINVSGNAIGRDRHFLDYVIV